MTETITKITNRNARTVASILKQFKGQPNITAKMAAYGVQFQEIEDMFIDLYVLRRLDDAEGVQLDKLGNMVKLKRGAKNDDNYRAAIRGKIVINKGNATIEDLYYAMDFVHEANYRCRNICDKTLRMILLDAIPADIDPETFDEVLQENKGGGVEAVFEYSEYDDDNTFQWSSGLTRETSTETGWSDVSKTYGGYRSNIV